MDCNRVQLLRKRKQRPHTGLLGFARGIWAWVSSPSYRRERIEFFFKVLFVEGIILGLLFGWWLAG